jgi:hypothetical protein
MVGCTNGFKAQESNSKPTDLGILTALIQSRSGTSLNFTGGFWLWTNGAWVFTSDPRIVASTPSSTPAAAPAPSPLPVPNPNPVTLSGSYVDYKPTNSPYWAHTSPFGVPSGVANSENIVINPSTFPDGTVLNWNFPLTLEADLLSYDVVYFGNNQNGTSPNGLPAPKQVNALTAFTGTVNLSLSGLSGRNDVLWEGWLYSDSSLETPVFEIGVMLQDTNPAYAQSFPPYYYTSPDGSFSATIYVTPGDNRPFITIYPTTQYPMMSGTIDFLAIFRYLKSQGIITGDEYASGWGLGVEVYPGSGQLTINHLSYTWQ